MTIVKDIKFVNIVSLGYFCGVAMELERKGLRRASYPFDWMISDKLSSIIKLIDGGFKDFLNAESLYQEDPPKHYYNNDTHIHFFHDFNEFENLSCQLPSVDKKYRRRIHRFYEDIKKPTLFVRYCSNEEDEEYVNNNREYICSVLQKYNKHNKIFFVTNANGGNNRLVEKSWGGHIYVNFPINDIERHWINAVPGLSSYFYQHTTLSWFEIFRNLLIHYKSRIKKKFRKRVVINNIYIHPKQYNNFIDNGKEI